MGWRGVLRSINAEINRQSRESDKRNRQHLKKVECDSAFETVRNQEQYLKEIVSFHRGCKINLDWEEIENELEPQEPINNHPLTQQATEKYDNFKPNIIHNVFGIKNWYKQKLFKKIQEAKILDEQNYLASLSAYKYKKCEWNKKQDLAKTIKVDGNAVLEVLQKQVDVADLSIGKDVWFDVSGDMQVDVNLRVLSFDEVIPDEKFSLRQSGTLSTKKMPKGEGAELYQDYVCSALLRVARETLGAVPLRMVRANAVMSAVSAKTGHLEDQVVVSVIVVKETLNALNISRINSSDSLNNFIHNMKFTKTKGFEEVEKIGFP